MKRTQSGQVLESDVEEKEIKKPEENFLVTKDLVQNKLKHLCELVEKTEPKDF